MLRYLAEAVVTNGAGLTVLGGLMAGGSSSAAVSTIDPGTGAIASAGTLATVVHDAAAGTIDGRTVVFGGGSPSTVAGVQSLQSPTIPPAGSATGWVIGTLPQPRSDLAVASISAGRDGQATTTDYVVGGYDGTHYLPDVLATTNGTNFTSVASLLVAVRYPAVAALGGKLYAFGGETASGGSATATTDIQMIDPAAHLVTVVGHLPRALYGAAAFVIDDTIYVAGGQVPGGRTQTQIEAFVPSTHRVLDAGLLPQAVAFAGYATVGSGASSVGYLVGGEVATQSGTDEAGVASGSLRSVVSLRPSRYGGPRSGRGRLSLFRNAAHRRSRQRPPYCHGPSSPTHVEVPVAHRAGTPGGSTSLMTPSSSNTEPASSPTRRTTTPSWRLPTLRGSSSGNTAILVCRDRCPDTSTSPTMRIS